MAILTIGTRGDVQPLLALAVLLQRAGHSVVICTHDNFRGLIESFGLRFADIECEQFDQSVWAGDVPRSCTTCCAF